MASLYHNAFHSKILNHPAMFNFAFRVKPGHGGTKRAQLLRTAPDVRENENYLRRRRVAIESRLPRPAKAKVDGSGTAVNELSRVRVKPLAFAVVPVMDQ